MGKVELVLMEWFQQKQALHLPHVLVKKKYVPWLTNVSKSLQKTSLKKWFDGENDSPNVEFIWNNIPVK